MTKSEAALYMGISERSLERYTKDNKIGVRYERGKTKPVPAYDQSELDRFKEELEKPVHKPAVERMAPDLDNGATSLSSSGAIQTTLPTTRPEDFLQLIEGVIGATAREVAHVMTEAQAMATETAKSDSKRHAAKEVPIGERKFLSVEESALYLGISQGTIERAIKAQSLTVHRELARGRRIKRADLDTWAEKL